MKIVILGPTGVGKTKMSVQIAKWLNAIVVNADAVQVYQDLNIGSAKVTEEEMEGVSHYLFDIKNPLEEYSVKDYQSDLRKYLDNPLYKNIVVVGGTGLYVCAGFYDYRFSLNENKDYSKYTNDELYDMVLKKDKNTQIHKNNRVRMERFLQRDSEQVEPKLLYDDVIFIGLTTNRDNLYKIIDQRVDKMIDAGLVQEVMKLNNLYPDSKILKRAIGYKEIGDYLNKKITLDEAVKNIKKNSRHYAKRQYTWFNNKMNLKWFNVNYDNFDETIEDVKKYIISCSK